MKLLRPAALLLIPALVVSAAASPSAGERRYHLDNEFWTGLAKDSVGVLASPFSWRAGEFLACAAVLSATGLTYAYDGDIQDWVQNHRTPSSDEVMKFVGQAGDAAYLTAMLAGLYVAGEVVPSLGLRKTAILGLESLAATGAVVLGMKCVFGRARPELDTPPNHFRPFTLQAGLMSLPSGHAASAFAVATSIACQTDLWVVDVLVYGLAGVVAASRVHDNKHWASDVILGAALGHVMALKIADLNRPGDGKVRLSAALMPRAFGLACRF